MSMRYHLTPAWHIMDLLDEEPGGREMAAATSAADGELIVDALNGHHAVVSRAEKAEAEVELLRGICRINGWPDFGSPTTGGQ